MTIGLRPRETRHTLIHSDIQVPTSGYWRRSAGDGARTILGEGARLLLSPFRDIDERLAAMAQQAREAPGGWSASLNEVRLGDVCLRILDVDEDGCVHGSVEMAPRTQTDNRRDRMAIAGEVATGVAHDINNLLVPALATAEDLSEALADTPALADAAEINRNATRAIADLSRSLHAMSRAHDPVPAADGAICSASAVINAAAGLAASSFREGVALQVAGEIPDVALAAPAGWIESSILNLCRNAEDAMRAGGFVTVASDCILRAQETTLRHGVLAAGAYLRLRISDTGCGMDADTLAHACAPHFTTKADRGGSGLGLASIKRLLSQIGGAIDLTSRPGDGTKVDLYIPIAA